MSSARQHHFVQARYLDGFLAPGNDKLWCYGRRRPVPFRQIPDKLARGRDLYRLPNAPPDTNIESLLERYVEGPGLAALRKLVGNKQPLGIEDRIHLARYMAFQEMRVPHIREVNREHMSESIKHMLRGFQETGSAKVVVQQGALVEGRVVKRDDPLTLTRDDIDAYAKEIANNPDSFDLKHMVEFANEITEFYTNMRWTVLLARPNTAFITSDCPVFRTFAEPGGDDALLRLDCSVCCPLSSKALLVMNHDLGFLKISAREPGENGEALPPTEFRTITDAGVANFNEKIVDYSHMWCFSGAEQQWITGAMQQSSKRRRPDFFAQGEVSGARWRRCD
jgi:hypothetical protein